MAKYIIWHPSFKLSSLTANNINAARQTARELTKRFGVQFEIAEVVETAPKEMTLLEVYHRVRGHLMAQEVQARRESSGACVYRNSEGHKCAVGCLIPDELYSSDLEGVLPPSRGIMDVLRLAGVPDTEEAVALLQALQQVHDTVPPEGWDGALEAVRKASRL